MALMGSGEGRYGGTRVTTPHLPTSLMWLRRALPTNSEISKMLCDLHLRPSLSGPWLIVSEDIIFSSMKSTLGCSTCPSAPL